MIRCNNQCSKYKNGPKNAIYRLGGCYCSICDYCYIDCFNRCPCCNTNTRHSTRSKRRRLVEPPRVV